MINEPLNQLVLTAADVETVSIEIPVALLNRLEASAEWPTNWRERISDGDRRAMNKLVRLKEPKDLWKSYRNIERENSKLKRELKDIAATIPPVA